LTPSDIEQDASPAFLIDDFLVEGSFAVLAGEPGSYKSFAALDIALCVATGRDWAGRKITKRAPIVYIAAEGGYTLKPRLLAWQTRFESAHKESYFLKHPVQLCGSADVRDLCFILDGYPNKPGLIVIDTLARCMINGDESSSRDMGQVIDAIQTIQNSTTAAVLVVHHPTKKGGDIRGSSALLGAVDTLIMTSKTKDHMTLRCEKQKDSPQFTPIRFAPTEITIGHKLSSLVLEYGNPRQAVSTTTAPFIDHPVDPGKSLNVHQVNRTHKATVHSSSELARDKRLLAVLAGFASPGATTSKWGNTCAEEGIDRNAFYRTKRKLVATGQIKQHDGKHWKKVDSNANPPS